MAQDNLPQSDQELQFKKRARRRLVGAVALVLLMIVVLPMVLQDRTAKMSKEDVVVSIPSQDSQMTSETNVTAAPIQQVDPLPISPPPVSPTEASATTPEPQIEVKSVETKPVEVKSVEVKQADVKPVTPKPLFEKPVVKEVAKPDPQKPAADSSKYFVQIGVFSDPDNVKQMQVKLTDKGLKSKSELIETAKGQKTRLRVGPYSSKQAAEAALDKMKVLNLAGMIVSGN